MDLGDFVTSPKMLQGGDPFGITMSTATDGVNTNDWYCAPTAPAWSTTGQHQVKTDEMRQVLEWPSGLRGFCRKAPRLGQCLEQQVSVVGQSEIYALGGSDRHRGCHIFGMTTPRRKRPRDPAQLAKLIVDIATGEVEDREPTPEERGKDAAARRWAGRVVRRGRLR